MCSVPVLLTIEAKQRRLEEVHPLFEFLGELLNDSHALAKTRVFLYLAAKGPKMVFELWLFNLSH